jgi:hypothetical protein
MFTTVVTFEGTWLVPKQSTFVLEEPEWFKDMMKVPIQYEDESPVQVNIHKWQGGKTIKL